MYQLGVDNSERMSILRFMEYTFRLPQIVKDKKLNQARVSEMTGISKNGVSNLCRAGLVQIRVDTVGKLCEGLGITPAELFVPVVEK